MQKTESRWPERAKEMSLIHISRAAHSLYHKTGTSVAIILGFCRFQNFGGKNQRKLRKCGYISSVIFSILLRLERLVHISKRFYPQMWITFPLYVDNYVK